MKYVRRYHATLPPKHLIEEEAAKLGPEWKDTYMFQEFPKWRYHRTKGGVVVNDAGEEAALGPGWTNSPGAFDEKAAKVTKERSDPRRWVDEWQVPGLLPPHRELIKSQLSKAEAAFYRESRADRARNAAVRLAFNGIAEVLHEVRILTSARLENEIPALVWDSAIAGGWYGPASDERTDGFPEQLGHYWVWADQSKHWQEYCELRRPTGWASCEKSQRAIN